jgi:two-component system, sensor histidine kinase
MFGRHQANLIHDSFRMRYENLALIDKLKSQALELQELSQAKTRFFAAASHDLRQPVQALGYYLSLLKPAGDEQTHVDRMAQCLDSMEELLEAVLDITRLDAGHVKPRRSATNLHELLQRQASLYEGVAAAKQLQLRLRLPKQVAWADTDPALLERILANLVNNAIRYTDRGGVLLALSNKAGGWAIAVVDTGCGIEAAALHDIFQEFTQLENPQRNRSRGVGLGLSIVQRICNLLDLPLSVRSRVGKGSHFELRLPLAQAAEVQISPTAVTGYAQLQGRILLVEDDPLVQESLASVLTDWGLEIHCASDGEQALALARQHQYAGVISDWRLPGTYNGSEVLSTLLPLQSHLKLRILLTGEHHESSLVLEDDVLLLRKPVRPIRLRALLTAHW